MTEHTFEPCHGPHAFRNLIDTQNGRRYWHCLKCGITPATADLLARKQAGIEPAKEALNAR